MLLLGYPQQSIGSSTATQGISFDCDTKGMKYLDNLLLYILCKQYLTHWFCNHDLSYDVIQPSG